MSIQKVDGCQMKINLIILVIPFLFLSTASKAQDISPSLTISAYTDVYYSYFTNEMEPNELQPFTTVSPRSKRFGLNVAQVSLGYNSENLRTNLTLHWGDIPQATWSEEFTNVQEANVGFQFVEDLWFDAGFFTTHIGTESFLPKNNFLSSTAVATYNEPFYQAGARIAYEGWANLYLEFWVLNGYNRFLDINDSKSFGVLLSYIFSPSTSLTYTNLYGNEAPHGAAVKQYRFYQNLYLNTSFNNRLLLSIGGDVGFQSHSQLPEMTSTAFMFNALTTIRYKFSEQWSITGRGEVFNDPEGFISGHIPTSTSIPRGLQLWGLTLGTEYKPTPNAYLRSEIRYLSLENNSMLFSGESNHNNSLEAMVTMGYELDRVFGL